LFKIEKGYIGEKIEKQACMVSKSTSCAPAACRIQHPSALLPSYMHVWTGSRILLSLMSFCAHGVSLALAIEQVEDIPSLKETKRSDHLNRSTGKSLRTLSPQAIIHAML